MKLKIVVCGLGYGGLSFLNHIYNHINDNIDIIAIDQNPFHYLQPEVYGYIANEKLINDIFIDLYSLVYSLNKNIKFIKGKVVDIDLKEKKVITENFQLDYDIIVISLGSRTFFPPIKGLREFSSGVKTIDKAMKFKHYFEKTTLNKIKNEDLCFLNNDKFNIVIGGGGLSGVEIAAEMAYFQKKVAKSSGCNINKVGITIVEALPHILYGMDDFIVETSLNRLKNLGVEIITGKKIVEVEKNKVFLENGKELSSDFLIWTGGIVGSSVINKMNIEKNKKNQIIVDRFLKVKGFEDAFAIGDCAQITDYETGKILPATAQIAVQSGKIVANHIINILNKEKLKVEYPKQKGILTALGGKYAAGIIMDKIKIKGISAYILKETVFKTYKFQLKSKIRKIKNG